MKSILVSGATAVVLVVVVLVGLELARRQGVDPVARMSDRIMPPRAKPDAGTSSSTTSAGAAAAQA